MRSFVSTRVKIRLLAVGLTAAAFVAVPATAASAATAPSVTSSQARVHTVLAYAYAQLGKPYRMGGAGPRTFDCSGLTMRAWGRVGVRLAHYTGTQQHQGRQVSLSRLQPGDLVFWGRPAYHVAIYVGGGRIIDAPHTGARVQIRRVWGHPSSATRL
jgi:cell wall-associated NlpC family hydrolase